MSNELLEALSQLLDEIKRAYSQGDRVLALRLERIAQRLFHITGYQFSARMSEMKKLSSTVVPQRYAPRLRKDKYARRRMVRNREKPNSIAKARPYPWHA